MALPGRLRLKSSSDFKSAFTCGRMVRGKVLTLCFKSNSLSHNRVGCSIPKSRVKNLVRRNRLQRLIREAYMKNAGIISGFDLVWVLQQGLPVLPSFKEIEEEIKMLLAEIRNSG